MLFFHYNILYSERWTRAATSLLSLPAQLATQGGPDAQTRILNGPTTIPVNPGRRCAQIQVRSSPRLAPHQVDDECFLLPPHLPKDGESDVCALGSEDELGGFVCCLDTFSIHL